MHNKPQLGFGLGLRADHYTSKISTETRLGIYQHAYCSRLIEALAVNYPVLSIYLGSDQFKE